MPHQMSLAGAVSLPVFWLAGAGAAVFWVLGRISFFFILSFCFDKLSFDRSRHQTNDGYLKKQHMHTYLKLFKQLVDKWTFSV